MSPKTNLEELFRKQFSTYPQGTSSKTQKNTGATSTFLCQSSQATTTAAAWVPRGVDTGAGTSRWQVDQNSLVPPVLWKCENQPVTRYRMPGSRILCFKIICIWHMGSGFSFLYERQDTSGASNLSFAQSKPSTFYGTNITAHSQWLPATASPRVSPLGVLFKKCVALSTAIRTYPQNTKSKTWRPRLLCLSGQATTAAAGVARGVDTGAGTSRWQDVKILWSLRSCENARIRQPLGTECQVLEIWV